MTARTVAAYFYTKLIVASCIKAERCEANLRAPPLADDSVFDFLLKHNNLYIPIPVSWNLTCEEVAKDDGKWRRKGMLLVPV